MLLHIKIIIYCWREWVLEYYNLTASSFADKISVQRSSMSHLLSGRNKPSLDFIMKLVEEFPDVSLEWILNGKGNFPNDDVAPTPTIFQPENKIESKISEDLFSNEIEVKNETREENNTTQISNFDKHSEKDIDRIVVFFKNGTFKNYM